jgi:hypothetical protein
LDFTDRAYFLLLVCFLYKLGLLHKTRVIFCFVLALFTVFVADLLIQKITGQGWNIALEFRFIPYALSKMFTGALFR